MTQFFRVRFQTQRSRVQTPPNSACAPRSLLVEPGPYQHCPDNNREACRHRDQKQVWIDESDRANFGNFQADDDPQGNAGQGCGLRSWTEVRPDDRVKPNGPDAHRDVQEEGQRWKCGPTNPSRLNGNDEIRFAEDDDNDQQCEKIPDTARQYSAKQNSHPIYLPHNTSHAPN